MYIPTNGIGGFSFLYTLSLIYYLYSLMMAFLTLLRVIVVLICTSLKVSDVEYLFTCLWAIFFFFGEMSI